MYHIDLVSEEKFEDEKSMLMSELREAWARVELLEQQNEFLRSTLNRGLPRPQLQRMDALVGDNLVAFYQDEVCFFSFFFVRLLI